jgi:hypothetical protein
VGKAIRCRNRITDITVARLQYNLCGHDTAGALTMYHSIQRTDPDPDGTRSKQARSGALVDSMQRR